MSHHGPDSGAAAVASRRRAMIKKTWIMNSAAPPAYITMLAGSIAVAVIWYHHLVRDASVRFVYRFSLSNVTSVRTDRPRQFFTEESATFLDADKTREKLRNRHQIKDYVPEKAPYFTSQKKAEFDV